VLEHLRPLMGLGGGAGADDRRSEAFAAWRRFFEGLAEQRPTVLVFEDLHWADDGLLDFVDHLVDWASGVPLLVVATARPELLERRSGWGGGKANATTLSLSPLTDVETARLLSLLLEQSVLAADVQSELLRRAGGNPLYAEEYVRMLRDGRLSGGQLPETVQGIIAARLDALPAEEKLLLQDAAVMGKVFWSGALAAIGGVPRWTAEERLHGLERKEFIRRERRSSVANEAEFAFRHLLVRDVAYAQIPRAGRADKHRLAAMWIDSLGGDRAEDRSEMLAYHYGAALDFARAAGQTTSELEERARHAFRDAGERALALSALPAAVQFFTQALELWPDDDPDWAYVALRQGRVQHDVKQAGEDMPFVVRALELLLEQGDVERAAEAEVLLAERDWFAGRSDSTFARLNRARSLVDGRPTSVAKARSYAELSRFLMLAGRYDEAVTVGRQALALAREVDVRELQAHVLTNIGTARVGDGDLEGYGDLEQAFAIAEPINSLEALRAQGNHASLFADYGELHRAKELTEVNLALAERMGIRGYMTWGDVELALLDYQAGLWDEAARAATTFLAEQKTAHYLEPTVRLIIAAVLIGRGETERALCESQPVVGFARGVKDPQIVYPTLAWRARLLATAGEDAEAGVLLDELVALAAEREYVATHWAILATFAFDDLGRAADAVAMLERRTTPTRWLTAALTYARGDRVRAADLLGEMGDHTDEAFARLRAAEEGGAREQASRALAFYRGVGATAFVRRAEALLPASA
jgi:tetratricopeptide (TPR) repeat protein